VGECRERPKRLRGVTERYIPAQCEPHPHWLSSGRDVSCGCGWLGVVEGRLLEGSETPLAQLLAQPSNSTSFLAFSSSESFPPSQRDTSLVGRGRSRGCRKRVVGVDIPTPEYLSRTVASAEYFFSFSTFSSSHWACIHTTSTHCIVSLTLAIRTRPGLARARPGKSGCFLEYASTIETLTGYPRDAHGARAYEDVGRTSNSRVGHTTYMLDMVYLRGEVK